MTEFDATIKESHTLSELMSLAIKCQRNESFDQAETHYRHILKMEPEHAQAWANLGVLEHQRGKSQLGLTYIDKSIALEPLNTAFIFNKAGILENTASYYDAASCYQAAIQLQANDWQAHFHLGACLMEISEFKRAQKAYQEVVRLQPNYFNAYIALGKTAYCLSQLKYAMTVFKKSLELNPKSHIAYQYIGLIHHQLKNHTKAIEYLKKSLKLDRKQSQVYIHLANCYLESCDWEDFETTLRIINEITDAELAQNHIPTLTPFNAFSLPWSAERQLTIAKSYSDLLARNTKPIADKYHFQHSRARTGALRIGYVSADFRDHTVSHLLHGMFNKHNQHEFEIYCYSIGRDDESDYRQHIKKMSDHFMDITPLSGEECATQIYNDGIHILVDLTGYTANSRLEIFALRPAPIQVSYLGFLGTLGADFIDYIITDEIVTPPDQAQYYTEKFVYMPHTYQVNSHQQKIAETPTREDCDLPQDGFIFCCFNNNYKIEPIVFKVWMEILKAVPNSVLWLLKESKSARVNLVKAAENHGVKKSRLIFAEKTERPEHLARTRVADLYLDTFSVNARTSASDALWSGIPILTCPGKLFSNRIGASLLNAIDLPKMVVPTIEEYKNKAIHLAQHPDALQQIKNTLNANIKTSPLFDFPSFTQHLEQAYQKMWDNFEKGLEPQQIKIDA